MKRTTSSVVVYLLLVFGSGVLVGSFGYRLYSTTSVSAKPEPRRGPDDYRQRYIEELRTRLNLNSEQLAKLDAILDNTGQRVREVKEKYRPEMKRIHEDQVQRIQMILDAQQRAEYEKFREERERKRQRSRGPGC